MITIFYGEMGTGKSYCAAKFAQSSNKKFIEGDDLFCFNFELEDKVKNGIPLSKKEVTFFVNEKLIPTLWDFFVDDIDVVVAQALYSAKDRRQIKKHFGRHVKFIRVWVPTRQQLKQIYNRNKSYLWIANALVSKLFFQADEEDEVWDNTQ